jgi:hypothetical protein
MWMLVASAAIPEREGACHQLRRSAGHDVGRRAETGGTEMMFRFILRNAIEQLMHKGYDLEQSEKIECWIIARWQKAFGPDRYPWDS